MNRIERKYDFIATPTFIRKVRLSCLNEYESKILETSIEYFCSSLDKKAYNPVKLDEGGVFYEFEINIFQRIFQITFEVDGIDAFVLDLKEIFPNQFF